jgi:hypothetical protein
MPTGAEGLAEDGDQRVISVPLGTTLDAPQHQNGRL